MRSMIVYEMVAIPQNVSPLPPVKDGLEFQPPPKKRKGKGVNPGWNRRGRRSVLVPPRTTTRRRRRFVHQDETQQVALTPAQLRELPYDRYLKTNHWKQMRQLAKQHYNGKCCRCGVAHRLDVHHKTYERLGQERITDLEVLCRRCHKKEHGIE